MSARHFHYEDDWKNEILECPECYWRGTFQEAGPRYFAEVMDCECPNCDFFEAPMLAIVNYSVGNRTDQRPRILNLDQPDRESPIPVTSNSTMRNLELRGDEYRYRSAEKGALVEFQVYYGPGARNDWSGDPTGVWLGVYPKEIPRWDRSTDVA